MDDQRQQFYDQFQYLLETCDVLCVSVRLNTNGKRMKSESWSVQASMGIFKVSVYGHFSEEQAIEDVFIIVKEYVDGGSSEK